MPLFQTQSEGVWTPGLTAVANVASLTPEECHYTQKGGKVICFGSVAVDPVAANLITRFRMSLPIASDISSSGDIAGVAFSDRSESLGTAISGDIANNEALFGYINTSELSLRSLYFNFVYNLI